MVLLWLETNLQRMEKSELTRWHRHCWAIHWAADDGGEGWSSVTATAVVGFAAAGCDGGGDAVRHYLMMWWLNDSSSDSTDCGYGLTADESWASWAPAD